MQVTTVANQTIVPLTDVRQGQLYSIVATGVDTNMVVEFQLDPAGAWFLHPKFTPTVTGNVVAGEVVCYSPSMRVRLATPQAAVWNVAWFLHLDESSTL